MSCWTTVRGTLGVIPMGETDPHRRYVLETVLAHLPAVTGSEGDMNVYINLSNIGYSHSDCDEFGEMTNNLKTRDGRRDRLHGWRKESEHFLLTLEGHLRDRERSETYRELMKWLCRLSKRVIVDDLLVRVESSWEPALIIDNPVPFFEMFEPHHGIADGDPAWYEFMLWERADSGLPRLLEYRKHRDAYNDRVVNEWIGRRDKNAGL